MRSLFPRRLSHGLLSAADGADPFPTVEEMSRALRGRIGGWIALTLYGLCFGEALLLTLVGLGWLELPSLQGLTNPLQLALACTLAGLLLLLARLWRHSARLPVYELLTLALALIIGFGLPSPQLIYSLPQIIWIPTLIAAATCEWRWMLVTAAVSCASLLIRHWGAPIFASPIIWLNAGVILALVAAVRWLHDSGLQVAEAAHSRMLRTIDHDPLTGLPSRQRFISQLAAHLRDLEPDDDCAVLRLDFDQFRQLNQSLGQARGDLLLRHLATRLRRGCPEDSLVARIGGDDFAVLLPRIITVADAERVAGQVLEQLQQPLMVDGTQVHPHLRCGLVPIRGRDPVEVEQVLQWSEQAYRLSQQSGKRRIAVFQKALATAASDRTFRIAQDLDGAVEREELFLLYQPIVDLRSGRTVRAEALLRWLHPDLGALGPAEFIPVAESNGSIHHLGAWILRQALLRMRDIRTLGIDDFRICVNRSPVEIRNWDGDAELRVLQLLQEFDLPGTALVLEITEGIMLEADPAVKHHLEDLRAHGIQLALDDFGTGYSSISQLHNHDLDLIKIDRQFVRTLQPESREMILCRSIIRMAHDLGLEVVAEGIETEQQQAILLELGCDYGQGYRLGRPMPARQLLKRLMQEQWGTVEDDFDRSF